MEALGDDVLPSLVHVGDLGVGSGTANPVYLLAWLESSHCGVATLVRGCEAVSFADEN